jgi:hypothetical protein
MPSSRKKTFWFFQSVGLIERSSSNWSRISTRWHSPVAVGGEFFNDVRKFDPGEFVGVSFAVEKVERDAVDIAAMHVKVVIRLGLGACRRSGPKAALLQQRDEPGLDQRRLARSRWRVQ